MSKIIVTYHPTTEQFSFVEEDLVSHYCDIYAQLELHRAEVEFADFSYGFDLVGPGGALLEQRQWGAVVGQRFISTDQSLIEVSRVSWQPEQALTLKVWFENFGQRWEGMHSFITPRPPQPFPSWTWLGGQWTPPTPWPETPATWDEDTRSWNPIP